MVRLEIYGLPEHLSLVQLPSKTFEVRVRGSKSAVDKLDGIDLTYPVNLADCREGIQSIVIDSERLILPDGITVVRLSTGNTTLKLEKTIRKRIPVAPQLTGNPSFGYCIADKRAHPFSVELRGPESKLADLAAAPTHPIDISGASEPVKREVTLDLPEGVTLDSGQSALTATIVVEEERTERTFGNIAIKGHNCDYEYHIRPEKVCLTVNGSLQAFTEPLIDAFVVYLDLEGLLPGIHVKPVVIQLPEGMQLVRADPQVFTVEIVNRKKN